MRHHGGGIGHCGMGVDLETSRQQGLRVERPIIELDMDEAHPRQPQQPEGEPAVEPPVEDEFSEGAALEDIARDAAEGADDSDGEPGWNDWDEDRDGYGRDESDREDAVGEDDNGVLESDGEDDFEEDVDNVYAVVGYAPL